MTRQDYIYHLDTLRKGVSDIIEFDRKNNDTNGPLIGATELENDRAKKTQKMFEDLVVRLYEDAAVSEKVKKEKILAGDLEQAEISFPDTTAEEPQAPAKATKRKGCAK